MVQATIWGSRPGPAAAVWRRPGQQLHRVAVSPVPAGVSSVIVSQASCQTSSNACSIVADVQAPSTEEQILLAQIADVCRWYAAAGPPTAQRQAAAIAELAHVTGGRTDLLARHAGQSLAWHDSGPDHAVHERAAQLCITAGADMDLIERWYREIRSHGLSR